MPLSIVRVTDRGEINKIDLTNGFGAPQNFKVTKYDTGAMAGAVADAFESVWENPESVPIIVYRVVINETTGAGVGAGEYVIMGTDADGTGMTGGTFMDGFDANATGWYDSAFGPVGLGATTQTAVFYLDENGGTTSFITAQYKVQDCSPLVAVVHIFYFPIR